MTKKVYSIEGMPEYTSVVYETRRQKDILDILDEMIWNAEELGWEYTFADDSFYIEYADGTKYEASECGEYGVYKKRNIKQIIYVNANDTEVYGCYCVNEWGNVY